MKSSRPSRPPESEAEAYFKSDIIYAERYLEHPKHVEIQILADKHGNVVHVGERDCSLQRRHQKVWEEAPGVISGCGPTRHARGRRFARRRAIGYDSVGTIECLVEDGEFYFLRNEHAHSSRAHRIRNDLGHRPDSRADSRRRRRAAGLRRKTTFSFNGFAIEGRVNAEDPAQEFPPCARNDLRIPRAWRPRRARRFGCVSRAWTITGRLRFDVAKLIVWAPTRDRAIARFRRAIDEYTVRGVPTTLPLLRALCDEPHVLDGSYDTTTLETFARSIAEPQADASQPPATTEPPDRSMLRVEVNDRLYRVRLIDLPLASAPAGSPQAARPSTKRRTRSASAHATGNDVVSPMHGIVVELRTSQGDTVRQGDVVAIVEAMKMMNEIRAHKSGTVAATHAPAGTTVETGSPLLTIE